jgi:hypothetical protein
MSIMSTGASDAEQEIAGGRVNPDDLVLSFAEWCQVNNFSESTGRRLIAARAVVVTHLSPRRIGITVGNNREYQQRASTRAEAGAP